MLTFFDADPDPGFEIFLTLEPGWKNSDPGSGINTPDPQHRIHINTRTLGERDKPCLKRISLSEKNQGRQKSVYSPPPHLSNYSNSNRLASGKASAYDT